MKSKSISIKEIKKYNNNLSANFHLEKTPTINQFFKTHSVTHDDKLRKLKTSYKEQKNITEKLTERELRILYALITKTQLYDKLNELIKKINQENNLQRGN